MPVTAARPSTADGWDTGELEALAVAGEPKFVPIPHAVAGVPPTSGTMPRVTADDAAVDAFIHRTEAEMRESDRARRREERLERHGGGAGWSLTLGVAAGLALVVIALAVLYFAGYGWPTQRQTATGLLEAHLDGASVDSYWVAVPAQDVEKEMEKIPPATSFTIGAIDSNTSTSTVEITVQPESGASLRFRITMQREGVGWRVSGIENDWGTPPTQ
jgi:hypothetical protein